MDENRAPGTVWSLRGLVYDVWVQTTADDHIRIVAPNSPDLPRDDPFYTLVGIEINRQDARLLARRLNECLDATRKR